MNLISALTGPGEPEIGCDECFDSLDVYVELTLAGQQRRRARPGHAGAPASGAPPATRIS